MAEEAVVMNEDIEMGAFQIIAAVGTARSCYIEAIHAAKAHDYEKAEKLIALELIDVYKEMEKLAK